jgi:hypothetical protein
MDANNSEALQRLLKELQPMIDELAPVMAEVHALPETTQNHYGFYMTILSKYQDNRGMALVLGYALVKAGANRQGVGDALKVLGICS